MRLAPFRLHRPTTIEQASELLLELGDSAAPYCGGTELLLVAKLGFTRLTDLVDLKRIEELAGIEADGVLRIGAAATHRQVERAEAVRDGWPSLAAMERGVGNLRVRNVGTVGGNLSFADPHSDPATYLTAAGALLTARLRADSRTMPVERLILGPYVTALAPGELLVSVEIPALPKRGALVHRKIAFQERPAITVAVFVELADGAIGEVRVAIGSVGARVMRSAAAEQLLTGVVVDDGTESTGGANGLVRAAADAAAAESEPIADSNGSVEYKRQLVRVLTERCTLQALAEVTTGSN